MTTADRNTSPTILLVEDEVLIRHGLAEYLRHCGYGVIEAASTAEAQIVLSQADMSVDAVLCSTTLSGSLDAFAFAQWAREHHAGLDVLMAGSLEKSVAAAASLCREGPHLDRPYDHAAVASLIKQRLAERDRQRGRAIEIKREA